MKTEDHSTLAVKTRQHEVEVDRAILEVEANGEVAVAVVQEDEEER